MEITAIVINPRMNITQKKQLLSKHKNLTVVYDTSIAVSKPELRDAYGSVRQVLNHNIKRSGK